MTIAFGKKFKEYRKKQRLSQEELSERLGVTSQAISKWECGRSYPDLPMLVHIAEYFNVSLDALLTENEGVADCEVPQSAQKILGLPDDDTLRVVLCKGNRLFGVEESCNGVKIPLKITGRVELLEVKGSVSVEGNIYGNVSAGHSVGANNIEGNVSAGSSIGANNITGNVSAGSSLGCDNIIGDVSCGGSIGCDGIRGDIKYCSGDIKCEKITGTIERCEKIVYIGSDTEN